MLFPSLFLVVVFVRNCVCEDESGPRVIGGAAVRPEDYPFIVSVFAGGNLCGGSAIALDWVLTAAHCIAAEAIPEGEVVSVRSGFNHSGKLVQTRDAKRTIVHPKFRLYNLDSGKDIRYDIGLVLLDKAFRETDVLKVAKLPPDGFTDKCTVAKVCGIGAESPSPSKPLTYQQLLKRPLKCVQLHISRKEKCHDTYRFATLDDTVILTMEAQGMKDACQGDSGGPLFCRAVVIGVISAGAPCGSAGKCASYTRVDRYLDFIKENTRKPPGPKNDPAPKRGLGCCNVCQVWWLGIFLIIFKEI